MCKKNDKQDEPLLLNLDLHKFNESVYIITHYKELLQTCVESLYETIKEENPNFKLIYGSILIRPLDGSETHDLDSYGFLAKEIINYYISTSDNCFIVHNPESGEPSIIFYAGEFISSEIRQQYHKKETSEGNVLAGVSSFAKDQVVGELQVYALRKAGEKFTQKAKTLSSMADYMSSRPARRSAVRNISSTNIEARNRALNQLTRNYNRTLRSSSLFKASGSVLSRVASVLGSKAFGVFTMWLDATPVGDGTKTGPQKNQVQRFVEKSLSDICIKYNNYYLIMNQTYISQGK